MRFDDNREHFGLAEPEFDISPLDDGHVDIDIRMNFRESLNLVRDDEGLIQMNEQRWRVEEPTVFFAEEANLIPVNSQGGEL